jgi:hypothetical protein
MSKKHRAAKTFSLSKRNPDGVAPLINGPCWGIPQTARAELTASQLGLLLLSVAVTKIGN